MWNWYLHVSFHEVENIKPRPIAVVVRLRIASERFVVAGFFIIWVSLESLLKSFPVLVTSKNAISCGGTRHVWRLDNKNTDIWKTKTKLSLSGNPKTALGMYGSNTTLEPVQIVYSSQPTLAGLVNTEETMPVK